jgi:hypothetical protein
MGMGYSACYADVIDEKDLIKIGNCGELVKKLKAVFDGQEEFSFEEFARGEADSSEVQLKGDKVFEELQKEFKEKTEGLTLYINYHDSDANGDRYDEVSGVFWTVDGMYMLTPSGAKMMTVVNRRTYVDFG